MKFSIRDLLLVTVIAALAVAWWVDKRSDTMEWQKLKEEYFTSITNMSKEWGRSYPDLSVPPTSQTPAPNPPKK